ncbi:uncharacterized protein LOC102808983 [Saccoglossus kowalevskii]
MISMYFKVCIFFAVIVLCTPLPTLSNTSKRGLQEDPSMCGGAYSLICNDRILCVKPSQLCDGLNNCKDGSDEEDCADSGSDSCQENSDTRKTQGVCTNPTGNSKCNTGLDDIIQQMLNAHNFYRCLHGEGSASMTLSDELNNYAQDYADHLASTGVVKHSNDRGENPPDRGENLWAGSDASRWTSYDQFTGEPAVADWYSEVANYDFSTNSAKPGKTAGHFTQVIWKASTELGCGVGTSEKPWGPKFFVVCQYRVAGNIFDFATNVPAPL